MKKIILLSLVLFAAKNITAQNVGIGSTAPLMKLHVRATDSAVALLENTQALNTNVGNSLYFKTGSGLYPYTGAVKTTGEGTSIARLGLFTYASASANGLLERLSITDAGNVGIGTINPVAKLHVANSNVLFTSPSTLPASPGAAPQTGVGNRMYWYADKAALKAGGTDDITWDVPLGLYSTNLGLNCISSGDNSLAIGKWCKASGGQSIALGFLSNATGNSAVAINGSASGFNSFTINGQAVGDYSMAFDGFSSGTNSLAMITGSNATNFYSVAIGEAVTASGQNALAMGKNTTASGSNSAALGLTTTASGFISTAMGGGSIASGDYATALGFNTLASGDYSVAMGQNTTASGINSTTIGKNVSTANFGGCLAIGDASAVPGGVTNCVRANEFRARFAGGYAFYTSAAPISGVYMVAGSNAWSSVSDSTKKEKFRKTDGEYVLNSISKMKLGSWNYKLQNAKNFRHYGAMAQEFYKAFGNDGIGKIGCDTLINSADIDGVMMIGLQALEKRSSALAAKNNRLEAGNIALQNELNLIKNDYARANKSLTDKLALLETKLNEMITARETGTKANLVVGK